MKHKYFTSGSLLTSLLASACCIIPVLLMLTGLNSVALFSIFEPFRPYLISASVILIGLAFYFTYRKKEVLCEDGSCRIVSTGKWNKISVWTASVISVLFIVFPLWGNKLIEKSNSGRQQLNKSHLVISDSCSDLCNLSANKENNCCLKIPDPSKLSKGENSTRQFIYNFIIDNHRAPEIAEIQKYGKFNNPDEVRGILKNLRSAEFIDLSGDEIIAAFPFSPKPSNNKVIFEDGRWVYAMCAIDALGISKMMKNSIVVESTTPLDKKEVKVMFDGRRMKSVSPENAVVWYSNDKGSFAEVRCSQINFFTGKDELQRWRGKHPSEKGITLSIAEAVKSGQLQFGAY